jgi:membrane protease YdiL (CAAX protease family)
MSTVELAAAATSPVPAPKLPRTWKFFGSSLWTFAAFFAMSLVELIALLVAFGVLTTGEFDDKAFRTFGHHGATVGGAALIGMPAALLVLWLATRIARRSFASYLALRWPSLREIAFAFAATAALEVVLGTVAWLLGYPISPEFATTSVRTARDSGLLWLLLLGFCVGAPIAEEFMFRGFLFRGWSASFLGPTGAIVLSAVVFALIHQQYDWFYIACIAALGLLFGYLRYRTDSTWLTVMTHGTYNLVAVLFALWMIS